MEKFELSRALDYVWEKIQRLNKDIDIAKPWEAAKNGDTAKVERDLEQFVHDILAVAKMLAPFLPDTANRIQMIFSVSGIIQKNDNPLFPKEPKK